MGVLVMDYYVQRYHQKNSVMFVHPFFLPWHGQHLEADRQPDRPFQLATKENWAGAVVQRSHANILLVLGVSTNRLVGRAVDVALARSIRRRGHPAG